VPIETRAEIVGDTDVVTPGIGLTPEDVDDPLLDAVHVANKRTDSASAEFDCVGACCRVPLLVAREGQEKGNVPLMTAHAECVA
jgi:hypothetical protein